MALEAALECEQSSDTYSTFKLVRPNPFAWSPTNILA